MAEGAEGAQGGPSLAELAQTVQQLAGAVGSMTAAQRQQMQTLEQLARNAGAKPAAPVDPSMYDRAKDEYLKTFATDPLAVRRQENQQLAQEILGVVRQELQQTVSQTEQIRRAEEMERQLYAQNPDLAHEGPFLNFYLTHLNQNPTTNGWSIQEKLAQAAAWARENKAERERQIIEEHERAQKAVARASAPGASSFRDPGGREVSTTESEEEANAKRFEVLQGRKVVAMGGGGYRK